MAWISPPQTPRCGGLFGSADPPNARNTKTCCGSCRNGLHYSDVRQWQGPCHEIWVIKAPELLAFVGNFPRDWFQIFKMHISKNLLAFSWQLNATYSPCTTVALRTKQTTFFQLAYKFSFLTSAHALPRVQNTPVIDINPLMPNDPDSGRTAPLTSKRCILYIYSTNIGIEYFKHGIYSPHLSLQNAVCFIILTYLVPVLFTFYIQGVLKLKKIIPAPNG